MRTVHILSGIPGCGKSTFAEELKKEGAVVCSADSFFINKETGEYKFDPQLVGEAHSNCLSRFLVHLDLDLDIVVDNTNIEYWERQNYFEIARRSGKRIVNHSWYTDSFQALLKCAERNIHGVPVGVVLDMARRQTIAASAIIHDIKG